jgi:protein involved in polysaccharide export with SLBB domain
MNHTLETGDNSPRSMQAERTGFPFRGAGKIISESLRGRFRIGALALASLLVSGCESVPPAQPPPVAATDSGAGPVVLREGDVVKLFFPGAAEYNNIQKIRTDGKLSLPIVGEIQAAGKTLTRLQSELSAKYKPQLQNSEVVVSVESSGAPVIISGAIASPGKFLYDRPTTLLEAIMGAGGFTDYAKKKQVRLIRVVNGQYQTQVYDLRGLTGGNMPVVYVKGGDVIHVPESNW